MQTENNNLVLPDGVSTVMKNVVVDNYNEHKNEKNKVISRDEISIVAHVTMSETVEVFLLTTTRNDGLLYAIQRDGKTMTLFLYNRIARKILSNESEGNI